ncbi:MAG: DUF2892 domain-containing protein [Imperialibacter sp.]|uniref:YgaP family membrane protein n=1 Tax=Imperialibacter sp. TaxID=2038411 RepID=UPI0032EC4128
MKKNVGKTDRLVRLIVGIAILAVGYVYSTWWGLAGALLMLPAIMGSDPVYDLIGVNTKKPMETERND